MQFETFFRSRGLDPQYKFIDENQIIVRAWLPDGLIQCHLDRNMSFCRRVDRAFHNTMIQESALENAVLSINAEVHCIKAWTLEDSVALCFETMITSPTDIASPEALGAIVDSMECLWAIKVQHIAQAGETSPIAAY